MSFLTRWSRLKREADTQAAPAKVEPAAPAELPPVDSLTFESDFAAFLRANVEESVKRAALKKLLHDPRFNVMDGLDTYIDDYTQNEGVSEEMLKTLEHARSTLFPPAAQTEETARATQDTPKPQAEGDPTLDVNPRQDT
ncbi:MAG TPA: DUF3306 domain-containing protein [Burkholderiales bacterium]|nr:DUF3306 domain-containing protein [Burkholderiales bacterium]